MTYYALVTASRGRFPVEDRCEAPLNSTASDSWPLPLDLVVHGRFSTKATAGSNLSGSGTTLNPLRIRTDDDPQILFGTADPSAGGGVRAKEGSLYQRNLHNNGQLWLKLGVGDSEWFLTVPFSVWARSERGFPITTDDSITLALKLPTYPLGGDPGTVTGSSAIVLSAAATVSDGSDAGAFVSGLAFQMINGAITIFGTPLPFTFNVSASTPGAASWALQLAQTDPGVLDVNVIGDPIKQVHWTVRAGGTFSPNVQG